MTSNPTNTAKHRQSTDRSPRWPIGKKEGDESNDPDLPPELLEYVDELVEQRVREETQELRERVDELEEELAKERQQRENVDGHQAKELNQVQKRVKDLESEGMVESGEGNPDDPPIYNIVRAPDSCLEPNERRVKELFKNLSQYTEHTPKGRVIWSPDLQRILQAAEPDDSTTLIESKTARRVMELAEKLTRDVARLEERDGKLRLIVPHEWKQRARERYQPDLARQEGGAAPSDTAVRA